MPESPNPDPTSEATPTPENPVVQSDAAPTPPAESRPCPNCGKLMPRTLTLCLNCGATLPPDPTMLGAATPEEAPLMTKSVWGDRITGALAAVALCLIPLGVFALPLLYFLYLRKRYPIFAFAFGVVSLGIWVLLAGAFVLCIGAIFLPTVWSSVGGGR